jgi:hypothetical protein
MSWLVGLEVWLRVARRWFEWVSGASVRFRCAMLWATTSRRLFWMGVSDELILWIFRGCRVHVKIEAQLGTDNVKNFSSCRTVITNGTSLSPTSSPNSLEVAHGPNIFGSDSSWNRSSSSESPLQSFYVHMTLGKSYQIQIHKVLLVRSCYVP